MKHFNSALIWGRLTSVKEEKTKNKKPYLDLKVECNSGKYGNVIAFCRIWSATKLADFKEAFKPGDTVYLKAFLAQYKGKNERVYTTFNLYEFCKWDPANDQHSTHRAVFIITGRVVSCDTEEQGDERLVVEVTRDDESAEFEFFIPAENMLDIGYAPEVGATARVKGVIAIETDQFNDIITGPRLVVEQVKVDGAPAGDVPF